MDQRRAAAALLALAAYIACSAAAPTAGDHSALELHSGPVEGCYYNFQHYGEGDRIMTNEPCLNCTCHNRMLMCYLRVCPFTKAIGQDCTVEKRADQCCPIVTCPDVPVDLLTSTSTSSPAEYGSTGLGKLDKYGCSIHGKYFPEGSKVPPTPNKPCEHCYCIRNMTTCVMQECTLHVDGCTPIYHKDVCCPVRYSCDHPEDEIPLLDDMTTTVRPTPGFVLTTTTMLPVTQMSQNCIHDDHEFPDGALIKTEKACEHCYCMKGDIVCVVQECGTPMENEGKNCTSLPPRHGQCCPDTYICEGDDRIVESATEIVELTSPPRRVGVEGSGYRNEDETYTEISLLTTEVEGSGEDFETGPPISTLENFIPDKGSSGIIDKTTLKPTESNLQYSYSTDKEQNTIPDSISDTETTHEPLHNKITLTHNVESITDDLNGADGTSQKDQFFPTESVFRKEDEVASTAIAFSKENEVVSTESALMKDKEKVPDKVATKIVLEEATTLSSDLLDTSTSFQDEHKEFTNPEDQETTSPLLEYTSKSQTPSIPEKTTPINEESSRTEKNQITDNLFTLTDTEIHEGSTVSDIKIITVETTTLNPNINEVNDNILPPSRIPGEGDCLLNGLTYSNNTSIPSTSNCHTGCRCVSSIIKCDPIICSPPPDYMENMNDCQPIYDTPESCCPTYVCSVKETIPPQSHSQMSGTESPKQVASECSGNDCISEQKHPPSEIATTCTSSECLEKIAMTKDECASKDCKDQLQESPTKPSQDCVDGICQVPPINQCEGEKCKIEPNKDTIPQKDLDSISHQIPSQTCDGQSGCVDQKVTELEECVDENCRRKNKEGVNQKPSSPDCVGLECELQDKSTLPSLVEKEIVGSTEKILTEKSTEITFDETDKKKTDSIDSDITTATEKLESDIEVTESPMIYTESSEKLSSLLEQTITDIPKQYDDSKEFLQTDIPKLDTITFMPDKVETTIEPLLMESPKITVSDISEHENIITETTQSQNTYSQTEKVYEKLTTEKAEPTKYIETETEESFTRGMEKFSTEKSLVFTDSDGLHGTESDEMYTKLPLHIIGSENAVSESIVTEKSEQQSDIDKEQTTPTIPQEILVTEKSTTYSVTSKEMFTYIETSQPTPSGVMVTDKVALESETESSLTEREQVATSAPAVMQTEKTGVTESITERGDIQTEPLNKLITDQEEYLTKIPEVTDKHETETKSSVMPTTEKESFSTLVPEEFATEKEEPPEETITEKDVIKTQTVVIVTEKVDVQTESPYTTEVIVTKAQEPMFTEIHSIQTEIPNEIIPTKEEIQTDISNITLDSTIVETVSPHESKIETTTTQKYDSSLVEQQTIESITHKLDKIEYPQITEESTIKQHIKPTEKVELYDKEDKVFDDLHKPEQMTPDDASRKDTTTEDLETYSPRDTFSETTDMFSITGLHVSKTETIPYKEVTESVYITPKIEELDETTKVVAPQEVTKEKETFTKPSYDIVTKSEEATSDMEKAYTTNPMIDATKSIEIFETVDHSITDSQTSKVPEIVASQFAETYTQYSVFITEKDTESSVDVTESVPLFTHKVSEMLEKATTISQISSKKLPDLQTTLAEDKLITEKSTEKYYSLTTTESEKPSDIENQSVPSESHTTIRNIEEVTEEIDTKPLQEEIPTDQKLDLESPHKVTSVLEENKTPETSTNALDIITKEMESHSGIPVFIEEQHESTSKTPGAEVTMVTKDKETISDNLTTQSTHKDEVSVDQAVTMSNEITKLANEVTESHEDTTINPLVVDEKQQKPSETEQSTKSPPTKSSHISEVESASLVTATQQSEIFATTDTIGLAYTVRGEDIDLSSSTETIKEISKSEEKLYETTEKHDLKEDNLPKETSSTQTVSQIEEEISTESLSFSNISDTDKNLEDFNEGSTKIPDMTLFELSSEEVKDKEETTQSIIPFNKITTTTIQPTISEDIHKVATTLVDEKETQSEKDLTSEKLLTTSSSFEDSRNTTDLPMTLNTGIYQEKLPGTTKSDKDVNLIEPTSKTPVEQELEEDKKQTHLYVTESGQSPEYQVTSKELEIESSTEINISFTTLVPQFGEKSPTSTMKNEYSTNEKVIPISVEQTNFDVTTSATESNINMQKEVSPVLNKEEELLDMQKQKTTTELLPTFEKEHEIPYEQTTLTEPIDKMPTKYPYEEYTVRDETTSVPPKLLEIEHDKETISTEGYLTNQNEEEHMKTILPETQTSKTELIEETTDEPKVPASTVISVPLASDITEKPVPIVTEIIKTDVTEEELVPTEIIQSQEETTMRIHLELSSEKELVNTEHTPLSESTEQHFTIDQQQDHITEASVGAKVTGTEITSTHSSPSDLPEEYYAVTENLGQKQTDDHLSVTQFPDDSSITEIQTDSRVKDKFTTVSPATEKEVPVVTLKETEMKPQVYSTESTILQEKITTKSATEEETLNPFVTLRETEIQPEIYSTQSTFVKEKITSEPTAEEKTPISIVTLKETDIQPEIYSTQSTIVKEIFSTESATEQETSKSELTSKETEIQPEIYSTQSPVVKQEMTTTPTAEEKTPISIVTLKETYIQPEIYSTQSTIVKEAFTTESAYDEETSKPVVTLKEIQPDIYNTQSTIIKEEITIEPITEEMTPKPIVTIKEADIQLEIYSTQPTIIKESLTTISSGELSKETEKTETSTLIHVPTEVISATSGSSSSEDEAAQTHKESDHSDDTKAITEPTQEFSETTPFLIELTEHAHEVIDDSSRTTAAELTTVHYKQQQTEGIQESDITKQYDNKYQTVSPIAEIEHAYKDKEQFSPEIDGAMDQKIVTTTALPSETSSSTEIISSTYSEFSLHEQEKKSTSVQDVSVITSKSPTMTSEIDLFTTIPSDIQKVTYSISETSLTSTEKQIHLAETEKPSKTNIETTLSEEILEQGTPKATTVMIKEETSTYSPKPEEKPTMTTLSTLQEAIKPSIDDEINENLPSPDFPPSGGYGQEPDYSEEDQAFGPGTCRYGGKVYVSAQQIPRDDPCDFCFCFRSDIICLQQSCPPPIHGCHEEPIQGFCCPRYECPVSMATTVNVTTTTTTTTTTLPPHFLPHAYKGAAQRRGCQIKGHTYKVGEVVRASSGPCLQCSCGGDGQMKCDPKVCTPEPMLRQMIAAAVSAKRRR